MKGNRTLVRDGDGVETGYTYDAVDRLQTAGTPVGVATYGYWEDGLLKQTDYGNGLKETRTYDAAGRLTTLLADKAGQVVSRFEYGYDGNGNRVSQVETRVPPKAAVTATSKECGSVTCWVDSKKSCCGLNAKASTLPPSRFSVIDKATAFGATGLALS